MTRANTGRSIKTAALFVLLSGGWRTLFFSGHCRSGLNMLQARHHHPVSRTEAGFHDPAVVLHITQFDGALLSFAFRVDYQTNALPAASRCTARWATVIPCSTRA